MSEKNINAYCSICGNGYHVCRSCSEQKTFKPWRSIVDNIEHYKIYLALHEYTLSKNKEVAKKPPIVLYDKRPNVFLSEIRHIANAIDVNTNGTITNCIEFRNN